jgi:NAD(P) transhydrogenase
MQRMLDMFRRPDDPPEFNHLYAIPAGAALATFAAGTALGYPEVRMAGWGGGCVGVWGGVGGGG